MMLMKMTAAAVVVVVVVVVVTLLLLTKQCPSFCRKAKQAARVLPVLAEN